MKTYIATYGMHENGHIFATREYALKANDESEAKAKAEALGKAIEEVESAQWLNVCLEENSEAESPEIWASLEELAEI